MKVCTRGFARLGLWFTVFATLALTTGAWAQTSDEDCAAGKLDLLSPEAIDLRLETSGRFGMTISWPDLDQSQATCYTLDGEDDLSVPVAVTGGFGDRVDRVLRFVAAGDGTVSGDDPRNLIVEWRNDGPGTYGNLAGAFNLSNNGGILAYDPASGLWEPTNAGLPMIWRQTNVLAMDRADDGTLLAALTRGSTPESSPVGLWRHDGETWTRIATEVFDNTTVITNIAFAPGSSTRFAVGTDGDGLFVTDDGGTEFTQWTDELDASGTLNQPTNYRVAAVAWSTAEHLITALSNYGVFYSENHGGSFLNADFMVPSSLDLAPELRTPTVPQVSAFAVDPSNPDRIVAALLFHGAYESLDGGATWSDLYGDLVVPNPSAEGEWAKSALGVLIDRDAPQTLVLGVRQEGLYRTTDGGATWTLVGDGVQPSNAASLEDMTFLQLADASGTMLVMEDGYALLESTDRGATWALAADQPTLDTALTLLPGDGPDDLIIGTWGGGIYQYDTPLALAETYNSGTSFELRGLDLGLVVTFGQGTMAQFDDFRIVAQTFQGWAVWRAPSHDPENMTLLGIYDRVNPEDCIEGYCGDTSFEIIPQCFAAKRAACFNFDTQDTIRFFDEEIYNGFAYYYAVTSFDYGNTALTTPQNNTNEQLFSPRWDGDEDSRFDGAGNLQYVLVAEPAAPDVGGEEIYAFPNPVRLGAGIPRNEGELVTFTNLPVGSRVQIFTTAGDAVMEYGPDTMQGGQIFWPTENESSEQVAPGVYLYKVTAPQREEYWGRIVVIR